MSGTDTRKIYLAKTTSDFQMFATLVGEYLSWCRDRYQEHPWFVERVFSHQSLASELEHLGTTYGPPNGATFLARVNETVCGGGAYRRLADGTCEMKRLFVSESFQGQGIGRELCSTLIASAKADGYRLMRLDTANLLHEAIGLYESCGFRTCPPHLQYPDDLMPFLVFMELPLARIMTQ